jgi:hypothetical protein
MLPELSREAAATYDREATDLGTDIVVTVHPLVFEVTLVLACDALETSFHLEHSKGQSRIQLSRNQ